MKLTRSIEKKIKKTTQWSPSLANFWLRHCGCIAAFGIFNRRDSLIWTSKRVSGAFEVDGEGGRIIDIVTGFSIRRFNRTRCLLRTSRDCEPQATPERVRFTERRTLQGKVSPCEQCGLFRVVRESILCDPIQPNPSAEWPDQPNPLQWENLDPTRPNPIQLAMELRV